MSRYISLAIFLIVVIGGGIAVGIGHPPGAWYTTLNKPWFNPPSWVFAPAWTALYILIAVAGWRTWLHNRAGVAMKVWFAQMALNFAWSPLFFGVHQMKLALIVITTLAIAIAAFIALTRREDRVSAYLFAPYLAWVLFATLLNASLIVLN